MTAQPGRSPSGTPKHAAPGRAAGSPPAAPGKPRLAGVDAARGLALLAMMAIHILPAWTDDLRPTAAWSLFAGRGVALFALLAGVSLALSSGGSRRLEGPSLTAARAGIAVRAVLIAMIGLLLGYLDISAQVILAYYGVMFLLALPLLRVSARGLTWIAAGVALFLPVLMQGVRDYLPAPGEEQPTVTGLLTHFGTTTGQLFLTGIYPALPWMAFICAGLAVGRLDLRSRRVQTGLLAAGCGLALLSAIVSAFLLGPGGGREQLDAVHGPEAVQDILVWGPDPTLPTDSWWWLAGLAPYSSTPLVILNTIGIAVAVLAGLLLLERRAAAFLSPLAALGSMTLTLYSGHLLLLATGLLEDFPEASLLVQIVLVTLFALVWRRTKGQGPLERLVAAAVTRTRTAVLARQDPDSRPAGSPHTSGKNRTSGIDHTSGKDRISGLFRPSGSGRAGGDRAPQRKHAEHGQHRAVARDPGRPGHGS